MAQEYLPILKNFLGDEGYDEHFTDPSSDSPGHSATHLEMLHYNRILYDKHHTRLTTYTTYKGWHLYELLMRLSALEGRGSISLYVLTNFRFNLEI
jgi:hypothetical protein